MTPDEKLTEALVHLEYLRSGQDGIVKRLDVQNGRIGINEKNILRLQVEAAEAKEAAMAARTTGMRWGAGLGASLGAAAAAFWHFLSGWSK